MSTDFIPVPIVPSRSRLSAATIPRIIWPIAALLLILLFNFFFTPGFFSFTIRNGRAYGSLIDILNRGAPVMLLSLGMTLVIATGGIDLSVGAVMAIAGATAAVLISRPDDCLLSKIDVHGSITLIVGLALLAALLAGLWNGVLVSLVGIQPIVATLILMVAGRGIAQLLTNAQHVRFENQSFQFIGSGAMFGLPFPITLVVITAIFFALLSRGTALGLFIESVGNNPTASRYCGVNARAVRLFCYLLSGLCAGLAGLIAAADIKEADPYHAGELLELDAILAVSVGGTALTGGRFSLAGSLIGAMVVQALRTTILQQGVPPAVDPVVKAIVVIAVCLLQSEEFRRRILAPLRRRRRA